MASRVAAAALQYSKWLSRFICWVWALYHFAVLIAAAIQPAAAEAMANTIPGMDTIMIANEFTYLCNSMGEKWLYSDRFFLKWLDKNGFASLLGKFASKINTNTNVNTHDDIDEEETFEEESDG